MIIHYDIFYTFLLNSSSIYFNPLTTAASDEKVGCTCNDDQYMCPGTGKCISSYDTCDGVCDCGDDCEDEYLGCYCPSYAFHCDDGQCTYEDTDIVWCSGKKECRDGKELSMFTLSVVIIVTENVQLSLIF